MNPARRAIRSPDDREHTHLFANSFGDINPLPTKTPPADILEKFVKFSETFKTAKSLQTDVYYLRAMFGDICPALQITSRKRGPRTQKRPDMNPDGRGKSKTILARCIEDIATADISEFITAQVRSRGLACFPSGEVGQIGSLS